MLNGPGMGRGVVVVVVVVAIRLGPLQILRSRSDTVAMTPKKGLCKENIVCIFVRALNRGKAISWVDENLEMVEYMAEFNNTWLLSTE